MIGRFPGEMHPGSRSCLLSRQQNKSLENFFLEIAEHRRVKSRNRCSSVSFVQNINCLKHLQHFQTFRRKSAGCKVEVTSERFLRSSFSRRRHSSSTNHGAVFPSFYNPITNTGFQDTGFVNFRLITSYKFLSDVFTVPVIDTSNSFCAKETV